MENSLHELRMADETGLGKTAANYVPLTPLSHLRRAASVFADRVAVIYGSHRVTYAQYYERCTRLASALAAKGVAPGDVVATLIPNLPAQAEAHFGVHKCARSRGGRPSDLHICARTCANHPGVVHECVRSSDDRLCW